MRRSLVAAIAAVLCVLAAVPSSAASKKVAATSSFTFDPEIVRVAQGGSVEWENESAIGHTSTQDSPLSLWDKDLAPGQSKSVDMEFSGRYLYHCIFHGGNGGVGMSGTVKVPVKATPPSGTTETTYTIQMAATAPPDGFGFDVQRKIPGSSTWHFWKRDVAKASVAFTPAEPGTYAFRSRYVKKADRSVHSGFSPAANVTVAQA